MDSENKILLLAEMAYFFQRMKFPIGRNAQCWSNFVGQSVHKMPIVDKKLMFQRVYDSLPILWYLNNLVCSENYFACVTDIALRLCLAWTKWILLYNVYACSNVYILFFFILLLCTYVRRSY